MDGSTAPRGRRTLTPAVVASAVFAAASAVFAIAFVAARGGLQMPVAATGSQVAVATLEPTEPPLTAAPTVAPVTPAPTVQPTAASTPAPTPVPTSGPTAAPTAVVPTLAPDDPLLALPACPGHQACREYVIERGDTLSGIISRYALDIDVLFALNPGLDDPSLIVVGQTLFLARDPYALLDPCPGGEPCVLYVVQAGDSVGEIAARYLTTSEAILAANPGLPRPIVPGQVIKLPRPV